MKDSKLLKSLEIYIRPWFQSLRAYCRLTKTHVTSWLDKLRSFARRKVAAILNLPYHALYMSGELGLIPVRLNEKTGKLRRQGMKRSYLWCAYYCGCVPIRGLFLLALPFLKLVTFKSISAEELKAEDVNMIIYLITAPTFLVVASVIVNFALKSEEMILYCNSFLVFEKAFTG